MTDDNAIASLLRCPGALQVPGSELERASGQSYFIELIVSSGFSRSLCIDLFFNAGVIALDPHPLTRQQSYATWELEA